MTRTRDDDACPGALSLHQAADGALARIRLPGGLLTAQQMAALAVAAREFGSGVLELTGRGNLQIRGIGPDPAPVAQAVADVGLLPSPTHERVRNIVASPLSGRVGDFGDVRALVGRLDAAVQAEPDLARLPGRFWMGLDDGRGDISGLGTDIGLRLAGDRAALQICGRDTGLLVAPDQAVDALLGAAHRFVAIRGNAWRVNELPDPAVLFDGAVLGPRPAPTHRPPVGWFGQHDGRVTLGAAVPLGVLPARTAEFLAAIEAPLAITPWRSVLVHDLTEEVADASLRVLAPLGLVFDEHSPWLSVSACTGSPGCAKSTADVRADATAAVAAGDIGADHRHYVGCERACGSPPGSQVLLATPDGYRPRQPHP
ncbi:precorrin-3B synthase [Mycolicibacterium confluentis]|uniref:Precorrin-3B synthase n=1 Tax=Mycolicibacterium confluentis TaxID=28047 RepID=A0A7I7XWV9_9MYCO|nr:precorrin-3B synthase [Mycolicibacterium confluentis]MCV7321956.1 precorrin-3B synthase [Mycolicibacterium confluentis]ORV32199.1 precorrin-3B synthase [Mycolicibacterium confluentis]BBZ33779.1 precorrin-3B synthase [Mycolicibacterium confluentis]